MDNSIYALLSGQLGRRRQLDVVANNMANLGTTGFKAERVHFDDIYKKLDTQGKGVAFAADVATSTDFTQGAFTQTGNDLDVAIAGNGLIAVQDEAGQTVYSRDGRFSRTAEGYLVLTSNAMKVLDSAGAPIQIPESVQRVAIAGDGTISSPEGNLAKIGLFEYNRLNTKHLSDTLFKTKDDSPLEISTNARLTQGFIESSNVNAVKTLTDLINVQRAYETGSNLMDAEHKRISDSINKLGKTA